MARKYRKIPIRDPRLLKKLKRDTALREASLRRAQAARGKPSQNGNAVSSFNDNAKADYLEKERTVMTDTNEEIRNENEVKEAAKEAVSSQATAITALIEKNNMKLSKKERKENDAKIIESMKDDDMKILAALLMDMRNKDDRKLVYQKVQVYAALITAIIALVVVLFVAGAVLKVLPEVNRVVAQANQIIAQTNEVINQANTVLSDVQPTIQNLNAVTDELANSDLTGMLEDVDALVVSSEKNMAEALQTITDIDIDSLNQAISDLSAIVQPLAGMFRR
ncbi:MAG: hypothetical protein K6F34_09870 [Lachnospiraceae bacterium]|nr:hypothetical protein [Lachnospiraceae bacterium]